MSPQARCAAALLWLLSLAAAAASPVEAPAYVRGEAWNYHEVEGYSRLPLRSLHREVASVDGGAVRIAERASRPDAADVSEEWLYSSAGVLAAGSLSERARGSLQPALQLLPFPLFEGKTWSQTVVRSDPSSREPRTVTLKGKVLGWETVKVPVGDFLALKIRREFSLGDQETFRTQTRRTEYEWYVPQLKAAARMEIWEQSYDHTLPRILRQFLRDRRFLELVSFEPGRVGLRPEASAQPTRSVKY